ncbi:hypothetical protein RJ639_022165, partial [Escallonia herrerae]
IYSSTNMATSDLYLFALVMLAISATGYLGGEHGRDGKHVPLFVFGYSLSDAGNNNYINGIPAVRANFWPYGETFFKYPTGRFCDGRLIPDFIGKRHGNIRFCLETISFGYGVNFASAGAGALDETLPGLVISLNTQLTYFKDVGKQLMHKLGAEEALQLLSKAVYLSSIGINDYVRLISVNSSSSHKHEFVNMVIGNLTVVIKYLQPQLPAAWAANMGTMVNMYRFSYLAIRSLMPEITITSTASLLPEQISGHMGRRSSTEYAKLPLIPPYLQPGNHQFGYGVNFASAGAGALDETFPGLVISLNTQLTYFKDAEKQLMHKLGAEKAMQLLSKVVYLFSIGSNDYGRLISVNSSSSHKHKFVNMVIGNLTVVIKEIYKQGGRNFGFLSLGASGCLPASRNASGHCKEELTPVLKLHNEALYNNLHKLERQLKGFTYSYFDFYTVSVDLIDNPSEYGLKEGKSACCGSGPYRGINSCGGKRGISEYKLCANATLIEKHSVRLLIMLSVNTQLESLRESSCHIHHELSFASSRKSFLSYST